MKKHGKIESLKKGALKENSIKRKKKEIKEDQKKETQKEVFLGYSSCIVTVEAEVIGAKNTITFIVEGKFDVRHEEELTFKIVANKVGKVGMFNYHGNKYYKVQEVKFASQRTEIVLPYDKTKKLVALLPDKARNIKEYLIT